MPVQQKKFGYLINTFQQFAPWDRLRSSRLYQILNELNNQTNSLTDQSNNNESVTTNFEYRLEIPNVQVVGTDVLDTWIQVRFPLDASTNTIGKGQKITRIDINAKVASAVGDYIADILVSKDKGATFESIFPGTNAQKLVLPQDLTWIKYGGSFTLSADTLQDGWFFRVDVLQADGTVEAVEIVIRGTLQL